MNSRLVLGLAVIVLLILAACGPPPPPKETSATLVDMKGEVLVDGEPASQGMGLESGMTIETGDNSLAEVEFYKSAIVRINENTKVIVGTLSKDRISLSQLAGTTWTKILRLSGIREYSIETPYAVATVRGTAFAVIVEENTAYIKVKEGKVHMREVRAEAALITVEEGQVPIHAARKEAELTKGEQMRVMEEEWFVEDLEFDAWMESNAAEDAEWVDEVVEAYYEEHREEYVDAAEEFDLTDEELEAWIESYAEGEVDTLEPETVEHVEALERMVAEGEELIDDTFIEVEELLREQEQMIKELPEELVDEIVEEVAEEIHEEIVDEMIEERIAEEIAREHDRTVAIINGEIIDIGEEPPQDAIG